MAVNPKHLWFRQHPHEHSFNSKAFKRSRWRTWKDVKHEGVWQPVMLRYNAAGDMRLGFECVHQLENGMGQCGSNVFQIADAVGDHICIVRRTRHSSHRVKHRRGW